MSLSKSDSKFKINCKVLKYKRKFQSDIKLQALNYDIFVILIFFICQYLDKDFFIFFRILRELLKIQELLKFEIQI